MSDKYTQRLNSEYIEHVHYAPNAHNITNEVNCEGIVALSGDRTIDGKNCKITILSNHLELDIESSISLLCVVVEMKNEMQKSKKNTQKTKKKTKFIAKWLLTYSLFSECCQ